MSVDKAEKIDAYERNLILVLAGAMERSPYLGETKKRIIERKLQEIIDVYLGEDRP